MIIYTTKKAIGKSYGVSIFRVNRRYEEWFVKEVNNQHDNSVWYIVTKELVKTPLDVGSPSRNDKKWGAKAHK